LTTTFFVHGLQFFFARLSHLEHSELTNEPHIYDHCIFDILHKYSDSLPYRECCFFASICGLAKLQQFFYKKYDSGAVSMLLSAKRRASATRRSEPENQARVAKFPRSKSYCTWTGGHVATPTCFQGVKV
jgi:hypothetical protein